MAKLTLANLRTLVRNQIVASNIQIPQASFTNDVNAYTSLIVKIGKTLMLDSDFSDRLAELDAEELRYGTTIEEYFLDLILPVAYDPDGETALAPKRITLQDAVYSKELGRKTIPVTVDSTKYENSMLGLEEATTFVANILKRLVDSYNVYKYNLKKGAIGEMISRVPANSSTATMITDMAVPSDTPTLEAWVKSVKKWYIETGLFQTETNNLGGALAVAPELVLYVKGSELTPAIDVDLIAGVFHREAAEVPVKIKVLEDFGTLTTNEKTWAIMLDPRGIKVHPHNPRTETDKNGEGEFITYYYHYTPIIFLSKFTNLHIWRTGADD